jgi:hypothetical protein
MLFHHVGFITFPYRRFTDTVVINFTECGEYRDSTDRKADTRLLLYNAPYL